jgi:hypothetical protein
MRWVNAKPALERPSKRIGALEADRLGDQLDTLICYAEAATGLSQAQILDKRRG